MNDGQGREVICQTLPLPAVDTKVKSIVLVRSAQLIASLNPGLRLS